MTDDLTHLKRRDSHLIRKMYLPCSLKKVKGTKWSMKNVFFSSGEVLIYLSLSPVKLI